MPAKARCRRLTLLLLLSLAIVARGAQSVDNCSVPHLSDTVYCDSHPGYQVPSAFDQADDACNTYLTRIGKELLDPPVHPAERNALPGGARSLPGVPAAIFMVLTGFLCVSFVNDRRIWLASLAGLLWLGQTGLSAIPQAASRLTGKINVTQNHRRHFAAAGGYRHRLRSDIEGSQYMGLLRHLAGIPSTVIAKEPQATVAISTLASQKPSIFLGAGRSNLDTLRSGLGYVHSARPEFAILAGPDISNSTVCSACATEHCVRFSPEFVFSNLARGPP